MPFLQIVRADEPEAIRGETTHGEIAHQLAAVPQHGREAHAAYGG